MEENTKKTTTVKNQFYKISKKQLEKDIGSISIEDIKLPKRATKGSAGYDFYAPFDFTLEPGKSIKIPTGIKVQLKPNCVLLCVPRSSLGFKYKMKLDNTIAVIDSDYINSDNEGHIWASITNMSYDKIMKINAGDAIFQGIIVNYCLTADDNTTETRNGGIGSTNKKT